MFECPNKDSIGPDCNIRFDPCEMEPKPRCKNNGTCYSNNTFPQNYYCNCSSGYSGYDCENDDRTCKTNTCW